jgi:hypothetical protein
MERYCIKTRKHTKYYFDPECKRRDFLYEYQVTGKMPLFIRMAQGRVGKRFVVKHYPGKRLKNGKRRKPKIVMTRVPDMSRIVASKDQRACRDLFKEAVVFGKKVIAHAELKMVWRKRYRLVNCQVFNKAIKLYLLYLTKGELIEKELRPVDWCLEKIDEPSEVRSEVVEKVEERKESGKLFCLDGWVELEFFERGGLLRWAR